MIFYAKLGGKRRRIEVLRGFGSDGIARVDALDVFETFELGDSVFGPHLSRAEIRKRAIEAVRWSVIEKERVFARKG